MRAIRRERFPYFVVMVYCIVIESNSFLYTSNRADKIYIA